METNNSRVMLWSAALIAAGLVLLGWTLRSGIVHFKDSERVVTVKGLSEQEVKADRVIWPLMYKQVGDDLTVLYNNIEKTNGTIIAFLRRTCSGTVGRAGRCVVASKVNPSGNTLRS